MATDTLQAPAVDMRILGKRDDRPESAQLPVSARWQKKAQSPFRGSA